jgi:GTP-binding protein HflX
MEKFSIGNDEKERCLLMAIDTGTGDVDYSIDELSRLTDTAGGKTVTKVIQKREKPDDALYFGAGKIFEVARFCKDYSIDLIICDDELTPSQQRNIENITDVRTIDRTQLILDIFAKNARTNEGKLQVELAQLKYELPRLSGKGKEMSRLGGGIGTRGPGETQLETDKRKIRSSIKSIEQKTENIKKQRKLVHDRRRKNGATVVAIVGYTNAGKSTLLNTLTKAGVLSEDKLFATLDPTARSLKLPDGRSVILIDTVGFISKLPTELVNAFRSTLEEVTYADLILNICDASDRRVNEQIDVTKKLIADLGAEKTPMITVFNKTDLAPGLRFFGYEGKTVRISAKTGKNIDVLLKTICSCLEQNRREVTVLFPYSEGNLASRCRKEGAILKEEYTEEGLKFRAILPASFLDYIKDYILPDE